MSTRAMLGTLLLIATAAACDQDPLRPEREVQQAAIAEQCDEVVEQRARRADGRIHTWAICRAESGADESEEGKRDEDER